MRIALTHNLRLSDSEEEAEFDTHETVDALAGAIERLGHRVERIEVSGPASRTVARLEAYTPGPHLQHRRGTARAVPRGLLPGALRRAGLPLHRQRRLRARGHAGQAAHQAHRSASTACGRPDGSSSRTVDELERDLGAALPGHRQAQLRRVAPRASPRTRSRRRWPSWRRRWPTPLERYPAGILVEEYIAGRDLTVPLPGGRGERLRRRAGARWSTSSTRSSRGSAGTPSTTTS